MLHLFAQASGSSATNAIIAVAVIVAGFTLGSIAAAITRQLTSSASRPEAIRSSAAPLATLAFSVILIVALVIALGIVNSSALDQLSSDLVTFLPRVLSAAIVLILGNVVGAIVETGVARSLGHVSAELRERVPRVIKLAITGFAVVIAANQLGVDTTIIIVAVAALFFSVGLAAALLAGLGGRGIAERIAAGRALRQVLEIGDRISTSNVTGTIVSIGSTTTQVDLDSGEVVLIPNDDVLGTALRVEATSADESTPEIEG